MTGFIQVEKYCVNFETLFKKTKGEIIQRTNSCNLFFFSELIFVRTLLLQVVTECCEK